MTSTGPAGPTATSTMLLDGLRDSGNQDLWTRYVDRYRPVIERWATRSGSTPADAEEIAQLTLVA